MEISIEFIEEKIAHKQLLEYIYQSSSMHSSNSEWYKSFSASWRKILENHEIVDDVLILNLGEIVIKLSYVSFGNISLKDIINLDELIIFSFYLKSRFHALVDLGANVGLHTLVAKKMNMTVLSYEPDPTHIAIFKQNMRINNESSTGIREVAVSVNGQPVDFVRVLGNTTSSHIKGAKQSFYGEVDIFTVACQPFLQVLNQLKSECLIKMDIEGYEAEVFSSIVDNSVLIGKFFLLEINSEVNREIIFDVVKNLKLFAFSQKTNWSVCLTIDDFPKDYREGTLFLSLKNFQPFQ
jgi:FkbM family methyltransferase